MLRASWKGERDGQREGEKEMGREGNDCSTCARRLSLRLWNESGFLWVRALTAGGKACGDTQSAEIPENDLGFTVGGMGRGDELTALAHQAASFLHLFYTENLEKLSNSVHFTNFTCYLDFDPRLP